MESFERQRFELRESIDGDGLIRVVVVGELDMATADLLTVRLRALGEAGLAVVLDVSLLSFVDACGLRAVTSCVAEAAHQGWDLHVDRNCAACFERLLELTGAADYVWPPSDPRQALRLGLDCLASRPAGAGRVGAYRRPRGPNGRPPRGRRPPIRRIA